MKSKKLLCNIEYISDIHLEYRTTFPKIKGFESRAQNLALLGDIGNPFKDNYREFIEYTSKNWDNVFVLTGNHEYWQEKYNMNDVDSKIRDITTTFHNVTFLNNDKYEFLNYTILGTTLWTKIMTIPKRRIGDDLYIRNRNEKITFENLQNLHINSVKWLEKEIDLNAKINKKIIVLSHHLPSYELIVDKFKSGRYSKYHDRFASHLDYLITDPVKFWLCGHSHSINEININNVHCAINAYGYLNIAHRKEKIITFS